MQPETIQAGFLIALGIIFLIIAIWMFTRANRTTTVLRDDSDTLRKDVLDDGAAPAARNQALIDAPAVTEADSGVPLSSETPAAAPEPAPAPAPAPPPTPAPAPMAPSASQESADDLRKIKGVGPKLVTLLADQGITSFAQVAAWTDADIERVDATLGRFSGRIVRDQWVEQAKFLANGDEAGFAAKFGQNG